MLVENLMLNKEIQTVIEECFEKKFSEFVQNVRSYPPFPKVYNNYGIQNNYNDNGDWMNNNITTISNNNKQKTLEEDSETNST